MKPSDCPACGAPGWVRLPSWHTSAIFVSERESVTMYKCWGDGTCWSVWETPDSDEVMCFVRPSSHPRAKAIFRRLEVIESPHN